MSFKIYKTEDGRIPALTYLPSSAMTPRVGMTLKVASGALALASGTDVPAYLCAYDAQEAVAAGTVIPVVTIGEDMTFETELPAGLGAVKMGDKLNISTDGMTVATGTTGHAEVVAVEDTRVIIRFVK